MKSVPFASLSNLSPLGKDETVNSLSGNMELERTITKKVATCSRADALTPPPPVLCSLHRQAGSAIACEGKCVYEDFVETGSRPCFMFEFRPCHSNIYGTVTSLKIMYIFSRYNTSM